MISFLSLKHIRDMMRYIQFPAMEDDGSKGFDRNFASFKCKLRDKFLLNCGGHVGKRDGVNCSLRENNYEGEFGMFKNYLESKV